MKSTVTIQILCVLISLSLLSCKTSDPVIIPEWTSYDETQEIAANKDHPVGRMQYKLIQSKVADKNDIWQTVGSQLKNFSEEKYSELKPLIYERTIPEIQSSISSGELSYELLTQWYLYRIVKYENDKDKSLHSIISINPTAVSEAKAKDKNRKKGHHEIYGMPILLKDNINTSGMPTTAGAVALLSNVDTDDAFIVKRIKDKGGIILGKANLSEWAYYFCSGCPVGYSAIGGQTLNPYGRKVFESGGSSAGSGTTMAANYAVAAVGTETSGSILSPSSQNSLVGLKPTIGLLSRTGIVPISSSLDTPGPMTRSVVDNAILLSAMSGEDPSDSYTAGNPKDVGYFENLKGKELSDYRFGVNTALLSDSIYKTTVEALQKLGATTIEFEPEEMSFEGFRTFLNADMKVDLPKYLESHADPKVEVRSVADVVELNKMDTTVRAPYGQALFEGIVEEDISFEDFEALKKRMKSAGINYFEKPMQAHDLDAVLSINNRNAGHAAMAKYPAVTVPMGYKDSGEPINLTFIARPFEEDKLLQMAYAFEQATKLRKAPVGFE